MKRSSLSLGRFDLSSYYFSQAFEDRHFTKPCLPHTPFSNRNKGAACSLVDPGLCGRIEVHAHLSFVIGMDRHALQTQFPPSRIELRNGPQFQLPSFHSASIAATVTNPTATAMKWLSTANQKEMFQSEFLRVGFLFMHFSQAFEDRHFRKFEIFLRMLEAQYDYCWVRSMSFLDCALIAVLERSRYGGALDQRFEPLGRFEPLTAAS